MSIDQPILSVVLVVGDQRERSVNALHSILQQNTIDQMEVLVMDCGAPGAPPLAGSNHPGGRVIRLTQVTSYESALVEGARQARAPVVAFLEEHCVALPGWAEALVSAHEGPWAAVCGETHNANPGVGSSDAEMFTRDVRSHAPAERREAKMLDGHNASFKRDILLAYGDTLEDMIRAEAVLLLKLRKDGHKLLLEPAAKYAHMFHGSYHDFRMGYYLWHRCFGHTRAEVFNWSAGRRTLRIILSPLVPWWHTIKTLVYIVRKRRDRFWSFVKSAPAILFFHYHAAVGQVMGIIFGVGDAADRFAEYERDLARE